jgi:hypothetical protein
MKKLNKKKSPLEKLKEWVKYRISCGDWQASYEEFLEKIKEFEK